MTTKRNIALCIILTIVTCGIYGLYWFVCITNEANVVSGHASDGTSGGVALILSIITCNIYGLYWAYKQGEKLDEAKTAKGIPSSNTGHWNHVSDSLLPGTWNHCLRFDAE